MRTALVVRHSHTILKIELVVEWISGIGTSSIVGPYCRVQNLHFERAMTTLQLQLLSPSVVPHML